MQRIFGIALAALTALCAGCSALTPPGESAADAAAPELIDRDGGRYALNELAAALAERRVVYIGERHDRYDHHLAQLAVLRALRRRGARLAIGLEQIQQPFQPALDAYVAGAIDEPELLRRSRYFERWGFDFRLYRPIFRFARDHGIPLLALNVDADLHRRYGVDGAALSEAERANLPVLDTSDDDYRRRLRRVFDGHHQGAAAAEQLDNRFERFYRAQLLWDESMAQRAVEYLTGHPDALLTILAGSGHLAERSGIPNRLRRRLNVDDALLLPVDASAADERDGGADYWLLTDAAELPPPGRLGVVMERREQGGVAVGAVTEDGAAAAAGIAAGDRLLRVAGRDAATPADVRIALLDKRPGEPVAVTLARGRRELELSVELR